MIKSKMLIVALALAAMVPMAKAGSVDVNFDGNTAAGSFAELLRTADSCQNDKIACAPAPVPERIVEKTGAAGESGFSALAAGKTGATAFYGKDGAKRDNVKVKRIITAKVGAVEFQWALGADEQVYAMGMARSMPEFETAQKMYLTDAVALLESADAASANKESCKESHSSNCTAGEKYYCTHTICYRCWLEWTTNTSGEPVQHTVCGSQTDSIDCEPTGIPCK